LTTGIYNKMAYHSTALNELKNRYDQMQGRLDRLYDDKLDEKISSAFYERKAREYSAEKETIAESIQKHSRASDKYCELGIYLYEFSQKARNIYKNANLEEKRHIMGYVFDHLSLDAGELSYTFSKPFAVLHEAVKMTNGSKVAKMPKSHPENFEPGKKPVNTGKNGISDAEIAAMRARWDDFRTLSWFTAVGSPEDLLTGVQDVLAKYS